MAEKNNSKNKSENKPKKKPLIEKILRLDNETGLMIPMKWKSPYAQSKKDYLAVVIGMNNRYGFERIFLDKKDIEIENENNDFEMAVGYDPRDFKSGFIIEERFTEKKNNRIITNLTYWMITALDDGIYGEPMSKHKVKDEVKDIQDDIFEHIREMMREFGEEFTIYTIKSVLSEYYQRKKKVASIFFDI